MRNRRPVIGRQPSWGTVRRRVVALEQAGWTGVAIAVKLQIPIEAVRRATAGPADHRVRNSMLRHAV